MCATDYAVGIPTMGRRDTLYETLTAFVGQTVPPKLIVVVDNNAEFGKLSFESTDKTKIEFVKCDYSVPGIIHGDQTTLRIFTDLEYKIAARWDDDLIPEEDCMEKLLRWVPDFSSMAGGMYPGVGKTAVSQRIRGKLVTGDENPRHLQFYRWSGEHETIRRKYLYSSFVYDVQKANVVNGFCTRYSQHSFRADTDFSLRMNYLAGGDGRHLIIDTAATALHKFGKGGTRDIKGKEKAVMQYGDLFLFDRRMRSMGIDPNY